MAKKPISRVRRKKGAVLFAVISIMALLIAMASTAYFTARSSYNSVISNYSYSQLYLSAISVSDMVADAVMYNSTAEAAADNDYSSLKSSIAAMSKGQVISAYSANISDPTASESAIIAELRDGNNPTIPGVVDGVVVNIKLTDEVYKGDSYDGIDPSTDHVWHVYDYKYTFTTTAYYRNNAVTVEDVMVAKVSRKWDPNDGTGGTPFIKGGGGGGNNSHGSFNTFFTATGQEIIDGKIERTKRTVKLKTHEISDDAFFQNTSTYFVAGNDNKFVGGVTSTGSVYLEKMSTEIKGDKNDWWIGQDLVITNSQAQNLNLTKDNSLYVGRDLIIGTSSSGTVITAKDIYVQGDLYILDKTVFNGNLHVSGNIYYEMPYTKTDEKGNVITTAAGTAKGDNVFFQSTKYTNYANGWTVDGNLEVNGKINLPTGVTGDAKFKANNKDYTIPTGSVINEKAEGVGKYTPSSINVEYSNRVPNYETNEFEDVPSKNNVASAIQSQVGKPVEYENYTSPKSAYENVVTLDFRDLVPQYIEVNNQKQISHYEYTDPLTGLHIISDSNNLATSNITVTLPSYDQYAYIDTETGEKKCKGYTLDIVGDGILEMLGSNTNIEYNIPTSSDPNAGAMPIVLKDNTAIDADKDPNGKKNDPAFSWFDGVIENADPSKLGAGFKGQDGKPNFEGNGSKTVIQTTGEGNVVFEMANIDKDDKYVPYDPNKYNEYQSVSYITGQKEVVGTQKQCEAVGAEGNLKDNYSKMLQSGTSIPKDEYQNKIMLVSNRNGGIGYDARRQNNAFCGYIYAPNCQLANYDPDGKDWGHSAPVFGGMIVSTYDAQLSYLYYAEPKPSIMSNMLGSLDFWKPGNTNKTDPTPDIPATEGTEPDGNGVYLNGPDDTIRGSWNAKGSNFVG